MKVLIVLLGVFALTAVVSRLTAGSWNLAFSGNLAMCMMLCFTAIGHFRFAEGMTMMMPSFLPFKREIILWSGVLEPSLGLALLAPSLRPAAGIILMVLFLALLPANIAGAIRHVHLEKASFDGPGPAYLWFRVPLQLLFIGWTWFFAIKGGC